MKRMENGGACNRLRDSLERLGARDAQSAEDRSILEQARRDLDEIELEMSWLHRGQRSLDERLDKIEQSLFFRMLRWPGKRYAQFRNLVDRRRGTDSKYQEWVASEQRSMPGREECLRRIAQFARRPAISVVLVVDTPRLEWLQEAVRSVTSQIYCCRELCICVDGDVERPVSTYLNELSRAGGSVRVVRNEAPAGISSSLNTACSMAIGDYIGFLNQHDVLSAYALYHVAEALQASTPGVLYSDEDMLASDGKRSDPLFKPGWSPELLLSTMYLSGFLVVSREAFQGSGGFRGEYEGAEDFDLCLRITEVNERVAHVPRVLCHLRKRERDPWSRSAGTKALRDTIRRRGWKAEVTEGLTPASFRVKHATERLVSIVICSKSPKLLKNALRSIRSTTSYPRYEIVVAEHCPDGENPEMARVAAEYECERITVSGPFNFSALNNAASEHATGDVLAFLNDDVEPLRGDWLEWLVSHLELEEVGVVGAKLLYPSGAIQHAGVVVGMGDGAGHVNRYKYRGIYWKWVDETRNVSAVTGACLAIRAELYRELGGFDTAFPNNYNDVDLCLRVWEAGHRVVYEPGALLRHYEGQTRKLHISYDERERFYRRWHEVLQEGDPYYNHNLIVDDQQASPKFV